MIYSNRLTAIDGGRLTHPKDKTKKVNFKKISKKKKRNILKLLEFMCAKFFELGDKYLYLMFLERIIYAVTSSQRKV